MRRRGWRAGDDTSKLVAGDEGKGRLVLVFAADLEEVEEVEGRSVDADEVVVWWRSRVWEGGSDEGGR